MAIRTYPAQPSTLGSTVTLTNIDYGAGNSSPETLRVVVATDQSPIPVTSTPSALDFGASAAAQRVAALLGNSSGAASFGAGVTGAQVLRVVPASDYIFQSSQSGTWTVQAVQSGSWSTGRTWTLSSGTDSVTVAGTVAVSSLPSIPAGANAIGSVSVSNFPATQPVSGTVAVTQSTSPWVVTGSGTAGTAAAGVVSVQGIAGMTAVKVDGSAVTQPISAASLPLPTGAATETTLAAINTKTPALGQTTSAGSTPVVIASDQSTLNVFTKNSLVTVAYDTINADFSGSTTDVYTYKTGGTGGTTVATVTITYTSSTKATLQSVVRT